MNGIPAEGRKACGGAGLATARCPGSLASGRTADQTAPVCLGTHRAWPQTQIPAEGPPGGLLEEDAPLQGETGERPGSGVQVLSLPPPNPGHGSLWCAPPPEKASVSPCGSRRWPGPGLGGQQALWGLSQAWAGGLGGGWQGAPAPHKTVSKSAVAAAAERQGPATPTGPGMRKELRECHGPGAQTVLISWLRFNPSPGLPGPPSTSSKGPCPRLRAHTAWPSLGAPLTLSRRLHL